MHSQAVVSVARFINLMPEFAQLICLFRPPFSFFRFLDFPRFQLAHLTTLNALIIVPCFLIVHRFVFQEILLIMLALPLLSDDLTYVAQNLL